MTSGPLLHWGAEALWEQLEPLLPGLSVEVVRSAASTNSALLERARAVPERGAEHRAGDAATAAHGDAAADSLAQVHHSVESAAFGRRSIDMQPCLLVAEQQTAGRGRQGRLWHSEPGASLTFSLSLPLARGDGSGLSLAVGVALCEALAPTHRTPPGPQLGLKWPNDLWLADAASPEVGRKLGGVLIETVAAGARRLAIIGIGLNVMAFEARGASTGFAALCELDATATAPLALARVALPLVQALKLFEREGFAAFIERFNARDLLRGHAVRTTLAEAPEGVARGVSARGELLVESAAGIVSVASGEVSVRLAAAADKTGP